MRETTRRVRSALVAASLTLPAVVGPGAAVADAASVYRVPSTTRSVYVRNKPFGYVIGTSTAGDVVDVEQRSDGFGFGRVRGSFPAWQGRACGWVSLVDKRRKRLLTATGDRAGDSCRGAADRLGEGLLFQPGSYFANYGAGATAIAVVLPCFDSHAYGNYSPSTGAFSSRYPTALPFGRGRDGRSLGVRYRTFDGRAVMVKDTGNLAGAPAWFFMRAECVGVPLARLGRQGPEAAPNTGPSGVPLVRPTLVNATPGERVVGLGWRWWGAPVSRGAARLRC